VSGSSPAMRRSYARVLIIWLVVLGALYAFQQYFS
jgi:TRAP-type C4-dicarboxylate transport system permease small subunit